MTAGDHLFVVSGCSGSGKSTLIAALEQHGEDVATEPGRQIVKEEIQRGGDGLPWENRQRFIDLCGAAEKLSQAFGVEMTKGVTEDTVKCVRPLDRSSEKW